MSIEAYNRGRKVFDKLHGSEDFAHGGDNSRRIRVQRDSLLESIAGLSEIFPSDPQLLIISMGALIRLSSEDYGVCVGVVRSPEDTIHFDIHGLEGPLNSDTSLEDIRRVALRRSGVDIALSPTGQSRICAYSSLFHLLDYIELVDRSLERLPEEERERIADNFAAIVADEIVQSGEFLDL